ncbi:ArsR/SmtB family transcription factor [Actinacidiphila acidipaludis]|uniref:Winged helix-turn-helix domain-containing protein n=1 Tax=Actinacidiphila acidipaludis TaxID=2873382 RepID=A0ABS7Q9T4_9ACTN|nr:winged helix-turn-helix domain-containing protein [Streptomyces acidipaludis]MBY8879924.1 winged helix-turn-helix domain-containing protein [Streptomyces acidipaludis]
MLRIHFTDRDLVRVRVATGVDPMWETLLAAHQLAPASRGGQLTFAGWRRRARSALAEGGLEGALRMLLTLAPSRAGYFPDFLTPAAAEDGLAAGLDGMRATPRPRLAEETARALRSRRVVPAWFQDLAQGDSLRLAELADAIARVYRTVVAPGWSATETLVQADRAIRSRVLRDEGLLGLLASLGPAVRWEAPTLVVAYPEERDIWLDGRGLRLVPSRFCWRMPVALADPGLPQTLVYPATAELPGTAPAALGEDDPRDRVRALSTLLGRTRAGVLVALASCGTTGELAVRLRVSAATASGHVSALRQAGLVISRRIDSRVVHLWTPLGEGLVRGRV